MSSPRPRGCPRTEPSATSQRPDACLRRPLSSPPRRLTARCRGLGAVAGTPPPVETRGQPALAGSAQLSRDHRAGARREHLGAAPLSQGQETVFWLGGGDVGLSHLATRVSGKARAFCWRPARIAPRGSSPTERGFAVRLAGSSLRPSRPPTSQGRPTPDASQKGGRFPQCLEQLWRRGKVPPTAAKGELEGYWRALAWAGFRRSISNHCRGD